MQIDKIEMGNFIGLTSDNLFPIEEGDIDIPFRDEEHMGFIAQKDIYSSIFIGQKYYTASKNILLSSKNILLSGKVINNGSLLYVKKRIKTIDGRFKLYAEALSKDSSIPLDVTSLFWKYDPLTPDVEYLKSSIIQIDRVWNDKDEYRII